MEVDIAGDMIKKAREIDPKGDYRLIEEGDLSQFKGDAYDLALSVFTFDTYPRWKRISRISEKSRAC